MTIEVHAVQALRAFQEATFGADSSGSYGSYTYMPFREGTGKLELHRDSFDPAQVVQHIDEYRKEVLGKRLAKLAFTMNLAPTGIAAGSGVSAASGPLGLILKTVLGGEFLGTGTTFTGGTAVAPTVAAAFGFSIGSAVGWVNASGVLEVREIKNISGSTLTLAHAFSGAPTNAQVAYAGATYYPTANPGNSLAFLVEGLEDDDRWLVTGAQLADGMTMSLDPKAGSVPSITFSFQGARWFDSSETSSSDIGTLALATYIDTAPIVGEAGDFRVFTTGSPTLLTTSQIHASQIAFAPQIKYVPYTAPDGVNTIKRWVRGRAFPTISGSWTNIYEDLTWFTARNNNGNTYNPHYQFGVAAGLTVVVSARSVQVINPQRGPDPEGLSGQMVQWKGRRNVDTTGTQDMPLAPFVIHLF